MASTQSTIQALTSEVSAVQQAAALLLASLGQGDFDPETIKDNIQTATQQAIDEVLSQLEGLDVTELAARSELQRRLLEIMNSVDPDSKFFFEFFNSLYTVSDTITIPGVSTVAGDDSVDISTTVGLVVGREYVIETATQQAIIVVSEILSATRFTAQNNIPISMTNATLRRTNWTFGNLHATAKTGQVLYTKPVNLDVTVPGNKAVVIRHNEGATPLTVYFMDGSRPIWQEAPWKWKRESSVGFTSGGDAGYIDVEYTVPVEGTFALKIVANSNATVKHVVGVSRDTRLKGTHRPPATPVNLAPTNNATAIGKIPTLQLSAYVHPALSRQAGVEFQLSKSATDFATNDNLVLSTGRLGASLAYSIPATALIVSTDYFWRARTVDEEGGISEWSTATKFTTASSFAVFLVNTPAVATPANNAEGIAKSPTLSGSTFSGIGGDAIHTATQYQIAADAAFTNVQFDSGTDVVNRTNYTLTAPQALAGGDHFVRLKQQGTFVWDSTSDAVAAALGTGVVTHVKIAPLDETRAVVCYADAGDSAKGKAVVVTINEDGTVALGTPVAFYAAATTYISAAKVDTDKVLVGFVSTSSYGYAVPLTVTGTTISVGTVLTVASAVTVVTAMEKFDTLKAVFAVQNTTTNGQAYVLTVSGTTVTAGAVFTFNAAITTSISLAALDNTKVIAAYRDSTTYGAAIVLSISGTTITGGTEVTFTGTAAATYVSIMAYNATTALVGYLDGSDTTKGKLKLLTISGTTITAAATATAVSDVSLTEMLLTKIDTTRALVTTTDNPVTLAKATVIYLNNATELLLSPALTFATGTLASIGNAYTANGKAVLAYNLGTGGKVERLKVWNNQVWSEWSGANAFEVKTFTRFVTSMNSYANGSDEFDATAVGPDNSIYAVGMHRGSGTVRIPIVVKFNSDGTVAWQYYASVLLEGKFSGVTVSSDGFVYACGTQDLTGAGTSNSGTIVKINATTGAVVWQRKAVDGTTQSAHFFSIACSPDGANVYAVGNAPHPYSGGTSRLLAKVSSAGDLVAMNLYGGQNGDFGLGVSVGADGSVYVATSYRGGYFSKYIADIAKYNTNLVLQWEKGLSQTVDSTVGQGVNVKGISVGSDGNVYVSGYEGATTGTAYDSPFVMSLSSIDGSKRWAKTFPASGMIYGYFSSVSAKDVVYVAGHEISQLGYQAGFVAAFSLDGSLLWKKGIGGRPYVNLYGVAQIPSGGVVACGFASLGTNDMIVLSLDADATGTSGTIPSIPALSWYEISLNVATLTAATFGNITMPVGGSNTLVFSADTTTYNAGTAVPTVSTY